MIVKNRITQYMGPASQPTQQYLGEIDFDIGGLIKTHPGDFTFARPADGTVEFRDFQTTGVVAFAKGCPISRLQAGKQDIGGHRVQAEKTTAATARTLSMNSQQSFQLGRLGFHGKLAAAE